MLNVRLPTIVGLLVAMYKSAVCHILLYLTQVSRNPLHLSRLCLINDQACQPMDAGGASYPSPGGL